MNTSELRKKYLEIRNDIPCEMRRHYSGMIVKKILDNWDLFFGAYDDFLIYYPLGSEVDLLSLAGWILKENKALYFPVTEKDEITFYRVRDLSAFSQGTFRVMEPTERSEPYTGGKAVSFTPGLVFDRHHNRIGYGKGYYDRFFTKYSEVMRIGVCFSACVEESIPTHETDVPMLLTCTENGVIV